MRLHHKDAAGTLTGTLASTERGSVPVIGSSPSLDNMQYV